MIDGHATGEPMSTGLQEGVIDDSPSAKTHAIRFQKRRRRRVVAEDFPVRSFDLHGQYDEPRTDETDEVRHFPHVRLLARLIPTLQCTPSSLVFAYFSQSRCDPY